MRITAHNYKQVLTGLVLVITLLSAVVVMKRSVQVHSKFHEQTANSIQQKKAKSPEFGLNSIRLEKHSLFQNINQLEQYINRVENLQKSLLQEMGGEEAIFNTMNFPDVSPLKGMFMKKLLYSSPLKVVFTGTSVTAGHDNYFNQSYPMVFEQLLKPILAQASIELTVSNVGMGNNPSVPYGYCTETIAGEDADLLSWEQSMVCSKHTSMCIELFMRNAFSSPSNPIVLVLDAVPDPDNESSLERQKRHMFLHKDMDLMKVYKGTGVHSLLATEAVLGAANNPLFSHKRMMDDDKPFENPKSWHPGPHGHAFVAHVLAYNYLRVYQQTLREIQAIVEKRLPQEQTEKMLSDTIERYSAVAELPSPMWKYGNLAETASTQCFTSFQPSEPEFSLQSLMVDTEIRDRRFEPEQSLQTLDQWSLQLWGSDIKAVEKSLADQRGYKDFKFTLVGDQSSGPISFQFEQTQSGSVLICEPPYSWHGYPEGYGYLNESSTVKIDGAVVQLHSHKLGPCFSTKSLSSGSHSLSVQVSSPNRVGLTHLIFPH